MRYFTILWVFICLSACRRDIPLQGTLGHYQSSITAVRSQTIAIDFSIQYDSLFSYLKFVPGKVLFDASNQSFVDFPLQVVLLQMPRILVGASNKIGFQIPVKIDAKPNLAGINTGLIQAKSNLMFDFAWNWQDINHHQIDQFHVNYQWITKPEMRLMGFPVQVHGVVDPLIQRHLPKLQERVLDRLNQSLSPNALVSLLNRVSMSYVSPMGQIALRSADIDIHGLSFNSSGLAGKLLVRSALQVGDSLSTQPNRWLEMKDQSQALPFQVFVSYNNLAQVIRQSLHLKEDQLHIHGDTLGLHVALNGFGAASSAANMVIFPVLVDSTHLGFQLKSLSVEGVPFFMRGHVKRKVSMALQGYRWSSLDAMSLLKQNSWGLTWLRGDVQIHRLAYTSQGLGFTGEIRGNWELRK